MWIEDEDEFGKFEYHLWNHHKFYIILEIRLLSTLFNLLPFDIRQRARYSLFLSAGGSGKKATEKLRKFSFSMLKWILQVPNLLLILCSMLSLTTSSSLHRFIFAWRINVLHVQSRSQVGKLGRNDSFCLWNVNSRMKSIIGGIFVKSVCHLKSRK